MKNEINLIPLTHWSHYPCTNNDCQIWMFPIIPKYSTEKKKDKNKGFKKGQISSEIIEQGKNWLQDSFYLNCISKTFSIHVCLSIVKERKIETFKWFPQFRWLSEEQKQFKINKTVFDNKKLEIKTIMEVCFES